MVMRIVEQLLSLAFCWSFAIFNKEFLRYINGKKITFREDLSFQTMPQTWGHSLYTFMISLLSIDSVNYFVYSISLSS